MTAPDWTCEGYGPEGRRVNALCFIAGELGKRVCSSPADCHEVMAAERRRVFARIQEGAAAGDPDMTFLAEEFTSPEQLLPGTSEVKDGTEEGDARDG